MEHAVAALSGSAVSQELQGRAEAAAKAKHQEEAKRLVARAPSKRLAMALLKQGWQIGAPQVTIGECCSLPGSE